MSRLLIWTDELTRAGLVSLCRPAELNKVDCIMYRYAKDNVILFAAKQAITLHQFDYSMGSRRDKNGVILTFSMDTLLRGILTTLTADMWSRKNMSDCWPNSTSVKRVRQFMEFSLTAIVEKIARLATHVKWEAEHSNDTKHRLLIPHSIWVGQIRKILNAEGLEIHLYKERMHINKKRLFSYTRKLFDELGRSFLSLPCQLLKTKNNKVKAASSVENKHRRNGKYKISVMYTRSVNMEERNDLFWLARSGLAPEDVMVSLESPAYPVLESELSYMREKGIKYIARNKVVYQSGKGPVYVRSAYFWKLMTKSIIRMILLIFKALQSRRLLWQWIQLWEIGFLANSWEDFFRAHNVRVDFRLTLGKQDIARCIAMDNLGGIGISAQYTMASRSHPLAGHAEHVYFCWHNNFVQPLRETNSTIDWSVITGYLFDGYFNRAAEEAKLIRQSLLNQGAIFIIALFDERITSEAFPQEVIESFYKYFFEESLRDHTLGLVIKSKSNDVFSMLPRIQDLVRDGLDTGRVKIIGDNQLERKKVRKNNPVFPVVAALASDLSVTLFSTPSVESALAGVRTINYDQFRKMNELYYSNNGQGNIIFRCIPEMIEAIRKYRANPDDMPEFGNYSSIIDQIDPYRDKKADIRIGTYIRWFLEQLNTGSSREEALEYANRNYTNQYGQDKIVHFQKVGSQT